MNFLAKYSFSLASHIEKLNIFTLGYVLSHAHIILKASI